MKFPRNAKIFRGQLDAAPFAGVFFLLLIFLALSSDIIFTPGIRVNLPQGADLPGTGKPTVVVAVDADGRYYFRNQIVKDKADLRRRLREAVKEATELPVLVVQADQAVKNDVVKQLYRIAMEAGIEEVIEATRPPPFSSATISRP